MNPIIKKFTPLVIIAALAAAGFYADPQTVPVKSFMGHWARARRVAWLHWLPSARGSSGWSA